MIVEDSYEGAVRRLNRLGRAGVDLAPPPENDRLGDLEELASLACDENERLKEELNGAQAENERLARELHGAHGEIDRLRRLTATLEETLGVRPAEPAATLDEGDESLSVPRQRGAAFYFFIVAVAGAAVAFLFVLRPWERHSIPAVTSEAAPLTAPVVAVPAPPIIPKAEPIIPKAEPIVPKVAATIPKVEPAKVAPAKVARGHAAKRHASKSARHKPHKRGSVAKSSKIESRGDDPLSGLDM